MKPHAQPCRACDGSGAILSHDGRCCRGGGGPNCRERCCSRCDGSGRVPCVEGDECDECQDTRARREADASAWKQVGGRP